MSISYMRTNEYEWKSDFNKNDSSGSHRQCWTHLDIFDHFCYRFSNVSLIAWMKERPSNLHKSAYACCSFQCPIIQQRKVAVAAKKRRKSPTQMQTFFFYEFEVMEKFGVTANASCTANSGSFIYLFVVSGPASVPICTQLEVFKNLKGAWNVGDTNHRAYIKHV